MTLREFLDKPHINGATIRERVNKCISKKAQDDFEVISTDTDSDKLSINVRGVRTGDKGKVIVEL